MTVRQLQLLLSYLDYSPGEIDGVAGEKTKSAVEAFQRAEGLAAVLESVQKECEERVAVLVREMAEAEGVNEEMRENEQMEWVRRMEMICGWVEEVVREEIMG